MLPCLSPVFVAIGVFLNHAMFNLTNCECRFAVAYIVTYNHSGPGSICVGIYLFSTQWKYMWQGILQLYQTFLPSHMALGRLLHPLFKNIWNTVLERYEMHMVFWNSVYLSMLLWCFYLLILPNPGVQIAYNKYMLIYSG